MRIPPNHVAWDYNDEGPVPPICSTCHFARLSKYARDGATGDDQDIWTCHRHAPPGITVRFDADDDTPRLLDLLYEVRWPVVDRKDRCGDWEPSEDVEIVTVDQAEEWVAEREKCATSTSATG